MNKNRLLHIVFLFFFVSNYCYGQIDFLFNSDSVKKEIRANKIESCKLHSNKVHKNTYQLWSFDSTGNIIKYYYSNRGVIDSNINYFYDQNNLLIKSYSFNDKIYYDTINLIENKFDSIEYNKDGELFILQNIFFRYRFSYKNKLPYKIRVRVHNYIEAPRRMRFKITMAYKYFN